MVEVGAGLDTGSCMPTKLECNTIIYRCKGNSQVHYSVQVFYPGKNYIRMPHRVDFFKPHEILFFSFKNANVKMKVGIFVAANKLAV